MLSNQATHVLGHTRLPNQATQVFRDTGQSTQAVQVIRDTQQIKLHIFSETQCWLIKLQMSSPVSYKVCYIQDQCIHQDIVDAFSTEPPPRKLKRNIHHISFPSSELIKPDIDMNQLLPKVKAGLWYFLVKKHFTDLDTKDSSHIFRKVIFGERHITRQQFEHAITAVI